MRPFSIPVEVISVAIFSAHVYPIKNFVILLNEREINLQSREKKLLTYKDHTKYFDENVSIVTRGLCH